MSTGPILDTLEVIEDFRPNYCSRKANFLRTQGRYLVFKAKILLLDGTNLKRYNCKVKGKGQHFTLALRIICKQRCKRKRRIHRLGESSLKSTDLSFEALQRAGTVADTFCFPVFGACFV